MKNKILYSLLISLLWLTSCNKEVQSEEEYAYLTLWTELEVGIQEAQTKAPISSATNGLRLGINVSKVSSESQGDPNDVYHPWYYNIQYVSHNSTTSSYYSINSQTIYGRLPLIKSYGKVNLAAWYPHLVSNTDVRAISFNANSIDSPDYLWAPPIEVNPDDNATLWQSLNFKHVMTCLMFYIQTNAMTTTETGKQTVKINKIVATTNDGKDWIPKSGTFNGITGEVTVTEYVSKVEYSTGTNTKISNTGITTVYLIFPEIPATKDGTDRIINYEFYVDYDSGSQINPPIVSNFDLDLGKVYVTTTTDEGAMDEYGFITGYRYNVTIRFDNFTKFTFDTVPRSEPWTDNFIDIEI